MADVAELFGGPPAVDQSGNLTIWACKTVVDLNAPKVTELAAATSFRITYSFLPGGYALTGDTEKLPDDRLTSPTTKESLGKTKPALGNLSYVDSTALGSAAVVLKDAGVWVFIDRRNIPQTTLAVVGQPVRGIKVSLGPQIPGPTDGTGKFTITQAAAIEEITLSTVNLVA